MDPEAALFRAWRQGDAGAFDRLYVLILPRLASLCRLLARNEAAAAELFQDTWGRAIAQSGSCRLEGSVGGWLAAIARHLWIDRVRRRGAERGALSVRLEGLREEREEDPGAAFDARVFLDRLDPEEQQAALLYHVQQLSLREVARVMGVSHPTVRARLASARRKWEPFPKPLPDSSGRKED